MRNPTLTSAVTDFIELKSKDDTSLRLRPVGSGFFTNSRRCIKAKIVRGSGISLGRAGITPEDEESFDDLKYIDIEFHEDHGMLPHLDLIAENESN